MSGLELVQKSGIPVRLGEKNDDAFLREGRLDVDVMAGLSKTEHRLNDPGSHSRRLGNGPILYRLIYRRTSNAFEFLRLRTEKRDREKGHNVICSLD
jgi:hypothetical protein